MASADVLQRAQWPTLSIYYKSVIFICLHKAFHDSLPVTLIDLISKKRATNYSTRTCASNVSMLESSIVKSLVQQPLQSDQFSKHLDDVLVTRNSSYCSFW